MPGTRVIVEESEMVLEFTNIANSRGDVPKSADSYKRRKNRKQSRIAAFRDLLSFENAT